MTIKEITENKKEIEAVPSDVLKKKNTRKGIIYVLMSCFCFSLIPIMATLGYSNEVNALTVLVYRFTIAAVCFTTYCLITKRSLRLPEKKFYKYVAFASTVYCGQTFCFYSCFQYISPALGEIIFNINPILVLAISAVFFKEKITRRKVVLILTAFTGVLLVLYGPVDSMQLKGIVFVLLASCCCSTYITFNKHFTSSLDTAVLSAYLAIGCAFWYILLNIVTGSFTFVTDPASLSYIFILTLFSTIIGFFCFMKAVSLLNPALVAVISLSEPVFTIILAFIIFGTMLTPLQIFGTAVLIFTIYKFEKAI